MIIIPLQALPNQTVAIVLNNQDCRINVYQKFYGLFVDLYVSGTLLIGGVIAENLNRIVRSAYFGFIGDLIFIDTLGDDDPDYTGLGSQFVLAYLDADEDAEVAQAAAAAVQVLP